ncbi:SprB repeat-containing protein, partial [Arthrospira platensis SPKY1]|nr:SprB repeat-containing protein [Arthrospira platensis SPKY1]
MGDCTYAIPDLTGSAFVTAADNCAIESVTQDPVAGTLIAADASVTITVTDEAGLTASCMITVTLPEALQLSLVKTDITCDGDEDGTITASATGGTAPYEYSL